jgi:hypothetical protein
MLSANTQLTAMNPAMSQYAVGTPKTFSETSSEPNRAKVATA